MERFAGRFCAGETARTGAGWARSPRARPLNRPRVRTQEAGAFGHWVTPEGLKREFEGDDARAPPAVVAVHELGFAPDGTPFITMEHVPGAPARPRDRDGRLGLGVLRCHAARRVGLEAIHAAGVLHGDLNAVERAPSSRARAGSTRECPGRRLRLSAALDKDARGRGTAGSRRPRSHPRRAVEHLLRSLQPRL